MIRAAANLNEVWGSLLIEELYRQGCRLVCISPGSRSTPLTVAAARHPHMETHIATDERAAGFFALGYARATGKPAPLICTSGTAAANYYPAVIEASVDHVPMLICSADRPPELLDTQANQTIRQADLFGQYVRWHSVLPCPSEHVPAASLLTTVGQAWHQACQAPTGPVHLNLMFREPLAPTPAIYDPAYTLPIDSWLDGNQPWTRYHAHVGAPSEQTVAGLAQVIQQSQRGVLVVGRRPAYRSSASILALARRLNWPVLADVGSGIRLGPESPSHSIQAFDTLLKHDTLAKQINPDCVLHLGGPLVSKWFPRWVARHAPLFYALVSEVPNRIDPTHCVTQRLEASPEVVAEALLQALSSEPTKDSRWNRLWTGWGHATRVAMDSTRELMPGLVEPCIAMALSESLPASHTLFVGNSMPIRDWDLFARSSSELQVLANRGASGIDGLLASALGAVRGSGRAGTLVLGDLSLMHDIGSLFQWKQSDLPLVVVVLNNQGGGIFGMLPIAESKDVFEPFFVTPHSFQLAPVAKSVGIPTRVPTTLEELTEHYKAAIEIGKPCLIEVPTQRAENKEFHQQFGAKVLKLAEQTLETLRSM
ncbi:MAG: 2-succinyl-5-enolpyruvyl-6-hydroxy-3-cyclohexene-1-carboxylic-acid synthase [Deltaproteobacteria bacterium]|nr:MAG: 2-succinyl-5-enolpyruvyl-6-hydroxy-3-cyclohexene-1-carboxylic-acid synthase [Deltaproteobacteria bacterium]